MTQKKPKTPKVTSKARSHDGGPVGNMRPPVSIATQFKPGQIPNPTGKPKGARTFKRVIEKWLNQPVSADTKIGKTTLGKIIRDTMGADATNIDAYDAMVLQQICKAVRDSDTHAFSTLADRTDGKPQQYMTLGYKPETIKDHLSNLAEAIREADTADENGIDQAAEPDADTA